MAEKKNFKQRRYSVCQEASEKTTGKKHRKSGMENEVEEISGIVGVMRKWATTEDEEQQEKENK